MNAQTSVRTARRSIIHQLDGFRKSYGEANDCTVTAFAVATGVSYVTSHNLHRSFGRRDGWPMQRETLQREWSKYGLCERVSHHAYLEAFLSDEKFQTGTWMVYMSGHVFCLKDGFPEDIELLEAMTTNNNEWKTAIVEEVRAWHTVERELKVSAEWLLPVRQQL